MKLQKYLLILCCLRRPPHGGRGLKFLTRVDMSISLQSPPARGAWVEIMTVDAWFKEWLVAPRTGGVG